jgi:hypothetical protein
MLNCQRSAFHKYPQCNAWEVHGLELLARAANLEVVRLVLGNDPVRTQRRGDSHERDHAEEPAPGRHLPIVGDELKHTSNNGAERIGERARDAVDGVCASAADTRREDERDEAVGGGHDARARHARDCAEDEEGVPVGQEGEDEVEDAHCHEAVHEDGLGGEEVADTAPEEQE